MPQHFVIPFSDLNLHLPEANALLSLLEMELAGIPLTLETLAERIEYVVDSLRRGLHPWNGETLSLDHILVDHPTELFLARVLVYEVIGRSLGEAELNRLREMRWRVDEADPMFLEGVSVDPPSSL